MRSLRSNKRPLYYAHYEGEKPIIKDGLNTLQKQRVWGEKQEYMCNYSTQTGNMETDAFGNVTQYSLTIVTVEECPFKENDKIWIDIAPEEEANYTVTRVGKGLNSYLISLKENV